MKQIIFFIVCISLIPVAFADVNTPNANAQLLQAVKDGNLPAVKTALSKGAFPNAKDEGGEPALVLAAANSHTEVVKFLLKKGADVNVKTTTYGQLL
jgi:ankyrin repeat protein